MSDTPSDANVTLQEIAAQFKTFETFVTRRFDEISMEINATSQQVDMAEAGIGQRFAEILEIIKALSFSGDGKTPANTGVELDAVIDVTAEAANTILDAADRIGSTLHTKITPDNLTELDRQAAIDQIEMDLQKIMLACSFNDLTSQRVTEAIKNLKSIEERISGALSKIGVSTEDQTLQSSPVKITKGNSQADIDAMFAEANAAAE